MIEDHGPANQRLIGLAKADGIAVPQELDGEQKAMRDRLESLTGAEFDLAYLQGQVVEHQKAVQLVEYEIGSGQDVELKNFAAEILPAVLQHLRSAQDLQAAMSGKARLRGLTPVRRRCACPPPAGGANPTACPIAAARYRSDRPLRA
jgi:putative membrane protein